MVITIGNDLAGLKALHLPQYSGREIIVSRRGTGALTADEFTVLETGGFELKKPGDEFVFGDVFEVTPVPVQIVRTLPVFNYAQYPDILELQDITSVRNPETGGFITTPNAVLQFSCRAEASSAPSDAFLRAADGSVINFSWIIYLPLPMQYFPEGTQVKVYDKLNNLILIDRIIRMKVQTMNAKIWV